MKKKSVLKKLCVSMDKFKARRLNRLIADVREAECAAACEIARRFEIVCRERGEVEGAETARYLFNALHARIGSYEYGLALLKHWRELGADL